MKFRIQQILIVVLTFLLQSCSKEGTPSIDKPAPEKPTTPTEMSFSLDIQQKEVESQSGNFRVNITSNTTWKISESSDWLSVSTKNGEGNAEVTINYDENKSVNVRNAEITFTYGQKNTKLTVTQKGCEPILNINKTQERITSPGGNIILTITSNIEWSITDIPEWISASMKNGSNDKEITFTCAENSEYSERSATLQIKGGDIIKSFTIHQDAKNHSQLDDLEDDNL